MTTITHDFNGLPIVFREDGYINMTKAAKHFKKKLSHFWDNHGSLQYLEALAAMTGIPANALWLAKRGGRKGEAGTWLHPKLAVFFARWLDVRFAVWCDLMIDNILHGNIQTSVVVPTQEVAQVRAVEEALRAEVDGIMPAAYDINERAEQ